MFSSLGHTSNMAYLTIVIPPCIIFAGPVLEAPIVEDMCGS